MIEESPHRHSAPNNYYPLQGLEQLTNTFLVAEGVEVEIEFEVFERQLNEEAASLQLLIKTQAFALGREEEIRLLVNRYHTSLTRLLDDTLYRQEEQSAWTGKVASIYKKYITVLENMIAFIDDYFPEHNSPERSVPIVLLSRQRMNLVNRLAAIEQRILSHPEEMVAGEIFKRLRRFASSTLPITFKVRYRDLRYKEELLRHLEEVKWSGDTDALFTPVEHMLIYLNYNSKAFIRLLTRKMQMHISHSADIKETLDVLLLYQKAFRQILPKPGMVLNPGYHHLGHALNDWFAEEISYLEKKLQYSLVSLQDSAAVKKEEKTKVLQKVLVRLSSDQTGLILRAADELRIFVARSLNEVFKTIVPHLSTPNRVDPSYKGMRTQSYVAEERDKEIAIETLQRIINKIKEY